MKNTITLLLLIIGISASAQIKQGTKIIGASLGSASLSWSKSNTSTRISINPNLGWFFTDRIAAGGTLSPGLVKDIDQPGVFTLGVTPYVRLYNKGTETDRFFLEANAGVNTFFYRNSDVASLFTYGAGVGYDRLFTKNVAMEIGLQYFAVNGKTIDRINSLSFSVGFQIFLAPPQEKERPSHQ
jgi:hypothetical protein